MTRDRETANYETTIRRASDRHLAALSVCLWRFEDVR
jgi:hypothetical protein